MTPKPATMTGGQRRAGDAYYPSPSTQASTHRLTPRRAERPCHLGSGRSHRDRAEDDRVAVEQDADRRIASQSRGTLRVQASHHELPPSQMTATTPPSIESESACMSIATSVYRRHPSTCRRAVGACRHSTTSASLAKLAVDNPSLRDRLPMPDLVLGASTQTARRPVLWLSLSSNGALASKPICRSMVCSPVRQASPPMKHPDPPTVVAKKERASRAPGCCAAWSPPASSVRHASMTQSRLATGGPTMFGSMRPTRVVAHEGSTEGRHPSARRTSRADAAGRSLTPA